MKKLLNDKAAYLLLGLVAALLFAADYKIQSDKIVIGLSLIHI